jgi:hypothetical protein
VNSLLNFRDTLLVVDAVSSAADVRSSIFCDQLQGGKKRFCVVPSVAVAVTCSKSGFGAHMMLVAGSWSAIRNLFLSRFLRGRLKFSDGQRNQLPS